MSLNYFVDTPEEILMSLHEDCLINYLQKPDELAYTTEILKLNNKLMEREFVKNKISDKIRVELFK